MQLNRHPQSPRDKHHASQQTFQSVSSGRQHTFPRASPSSTQRIAKAHIHGSDHATLDSASMFNADQNSAATAQAGAQEHALPVTPKASKQDVFTDQSTISTPKREPADVVPPSFAHQTMAMPSMPWMGHGNPYSMPGMHPYMTSPATPRTTPGLLYGGYGVPQLYYSNGMYYDIYGNAFMGQPYQTGVPPPPPMLLPSHGSEESDPTVGQSTNLGKNQERRRE